MTLGIFYENVGTVADRYARIVEDPTDASNHALTFWVKNALIDADYQGHTKGRIQTDVQWGPDSPVTSLCVKQRIYLHPALAVLPDYFGDNWWLSILFGELWLGAPWQGHTNAARISMYLAPSLGNGTLHFAVHAQAMPSFTPIWDRVSNYVVPVGEWLSLEYRYRQGNAANGRFVLIVEADSDAGPTTVVDVTGYTYDPAADAPGGTGPVPLTNWNPQKLYSSDNVLHWVRDQGGADPTLECSMRRPPRGSSSSLKERSQPPSPCNIRRYSSLAVVCVGEGPDRLAVYG